MPVVATMTVLALLRDDDGGAQPFFDPPLMREMVTEGLAAESADVLAQALTLVDELEALIGHYRSSVYQSMDLYAAATEEPGADAVSLQPRLTALDAERGDVMREIIRIRRSLVTLLDAAQWRAVFD